MHLFISLTPEEDLLYGIIAFAVFLGSLIWHMWRTSRSWNTYLTRLHKIRKDTTITAIDFEVVSDESALYVHHVEIPTTTPSSQPSQSPTKEHAL